MFSRATASLDKERNRASRATASLDKERNRVLFDKSVCGVLLQIDKKYMHWEKIITKIYYTADKYNFKNNINLI